MDYGLRWCRPVMTVVALILIATPTSAQRQPTVREVLDNFLRESAEAADRPASEPTQVVTSRQEFAENYASYIFGTATQFPCSDSIAPVGNELHDCQRLVVVVVDTTAARPRGEFGPLVGIYPIWEDLDTTSDFSSALMVALVVNYGATTEYEGGTVTYASNEYGRLQILPPLGSEPRTHCLWIRRTGNNWSGAMVASQVDAECYDQAPPQPNQFDLSVRRRQYSNALISAYPTTARWRWTRPDREPGKRDEHFIGIKCGDGWCQVGHRQFQPRPLRGPNGQAPAWIPTRQIPGFYDAQHLAVLKKGWEQGDTVGPFEPGPWAEVRALRVGSNWDWSEPVEVAAIQVADQELDNDDYSEKFGLERDPQGFDHIRRGRVVLYRPDQYPAGAAAYINRYVTNRIETASVIASRYVHGVAGSARWHWRDDKDETIWVPCWQGCCEIEEANAEAN